MELNELKRNLQRVKDMSWVKSKRRGDTGIGYTLETLLDIKENNLKTPDFGNIELSLSVKTQATK